MKSRVLNVGHGQHLLAWCFLLAPVYAAGQTVSLPVASDFREGEQWTWRRVDELTKLETKTFWRRRVHSENGRIFLNSNNRRFTIDRGFRPWAREWPLEVGKTWTFVTDWEETEGGGTTVAQAKVFGLESVTVPAGTFSAVKIEYKGSWNMKDFAGRGWSGEVTETFWYCAEIKADVKHEHLTYGRHGSEHWADELTAYDPAAK